MAWPLHRLPICSLPMAVRVESTRAGSPLRPNNAAKPSKRGGVECASPLASHGILN